MIISIYYSDSKKLFLPVLLSTNEITKWIIGLHAQFHRAQASRTMPNFSLEEFTELHSNVLAALGAFRNEMIEGNKSD